MNELRNRKRASYSSQNSDNIELPSYTSASGNDGAPKPSTSTETALPEPQYTKKSIADSPDFTSLTVTNDRWVNLSLSSPSSPNTPLFFVYNVQFTLNGPDVILSRKSKEGPVLAVCNILWSRDNVFTLGDPASALSNSNSLNWENLRRTSRWTHAVYEFSYFINGGRRRFVWQRTAQPWYADQPSMELREKLEGGGEGKVLAVYIGCQGFVSKKRGEFYVRRREDGKEQWGDWEMVVLITGFGIIEASRRRARARRSGGGGG